MSFMRQKAMAVFEAAERRRQEERHRVEMERVRREIERREALFARARERMSSSWVWVEFSDCDFKVVAATPDAGMMVITDDDVVFLRLSRHPSGSPRVALVRPPSGVSEAAFIDAARWIPVCDPVRTAEEIGGWLRDQERESLARSDS